MCTSSWAKTPRAMRSTPEERARDPHLESAAVLVKLPQDQGTSRPRSSTAANTASTSGHRPRAAPRGA